MRRCGWRSRLGLVSTGSVSIGCALLTLGCTVVPSNRPSDSSAAPTRDSGSTGEAWGAAAVVYGRGTDELAYDSVLRLAPMPPRNGEQVKTLAAAPVPVDAVACSPDGTRVLVLSQRRQARWWVVNSDGTRLKELHLSRRGLEVGNTWWAPDGKSLLVLRQTIGPPARTSLTRLFLGTSSGGAVTAQTLIPLGASRNISTVAASPDGRQLVVGVWEEVGPGPRLKSSLWVLPVSDDPTARPPSPYVWREVATDETVSFADAVWSPDGRWIAAAGGLITSGDRGSTQMARHIYLMRPDGSQLHRVKGRANRNTADYQWLPEGGTLAFLTGDYHDERNFGPTVRLALLDADTGRTRILSNRLDLDGYAVSPDGRAYLALRGRRLLLQPFAAAAKPQLIDRGGYFGGWSWCVRSGALQLHSQTPIPAQ